MIDELRYGRVRYICYIIVDILCLIFANYLANLIYLNMQVNSFLENLLHMQLGHFVYDEYRPVIIFMVIIDLIVTMVFNTLRWVLRRKKRAEFVEGLKHIGISFAILAVVLYTLRAGAEYSRAAVFLAYVIYYILFVGVHIVIKRITCIAHKRKKNTTAMLMTTDRFVDEGREERNKRNIHILSPLFSLSVNCLSIFSILLAIGYEFIIISNVFLCIIILRR